MAKTKHKIPAEIAVVSQTPGTDTAFFREKTGFGPGPEEQRVMQTPIRELRSRFVALSWSRIAKRYPFFAQLPGIKERIK